MLQDKVIAIYCLVDDLLKEMNHTEHNNRTFTDGQVIATALVSALCFGATRPWHYAIWTAISLEGS
ncbi:MAG: hypothetical protein AAGB24_02120 [Bacteroidota bacterium]